MALPVQTNNKLSTTLHGDEKYASMNWDELGFDLVPADYMYIMKSSENGCFSNGTITRYGNIEISPASVILNFGQGLLEGLKATRREDGKVMVFRPDQNALRMEKGAERICMPSPSVDQFVEAVKQTVLANKHWVPPPGKGSLYVRPLLIGSGARLGPGPAPEYTFLLYASPVGLSCHKNLINLVVEDKIPRATPGGTGGIKSVSNYSPVFKVLAEAKAKGFSDVLFLDAATGKNIEEVSSCNIFVVKGNVVSTPATDAGTVLAGITRKSVMEIAADLGYQVEERVIPVDDLLEADEVFCTGNAVGLNPVNSITYQGKRTEYKPREESVSQELHKILTGIQAGRIEDKKGWTIVID